MQHLAVAARPSPSIDLLTQRIRESVAAGHLQAGRALLGALQRLAAPRIGLAEIETMLLLREGRPAEAATQLDHAVETWPDAMWPRLQRAEARMLLNDPSGAATDAAEAVILDRTNHKAKAVLGVALIELGAYQDAAACLDEAVRHVPNDANLRRGLATALERGGDPAAARATLEAGLQVMPTSLMLHLDVIMVAMRQRDFAAAAAQAEAARALGIADACVFGLLGHALSSLGEHGPALDAYSEALKLAPEDKYVRHLVAAGKMAPQADRAPGAYVEAVFDGYADRFEQHLISLGYRVPGLVRSVLMQTMPQLSAGEPCGPLLDLGCGTGLVGVVLSDLDVGRRVGVDISTAMLAEAKAKQLYDELIQSDIEDLLGATQDSWQIIVAADVFCYFGDLRRVIALAAQRLRPGGVLVFTVEEQVESVDWKLERVGRFAHACGYIQTVIAESGLCEVVFRREVLRFEGDAPVAGLLTVLRRPS